MPTPTIPAGNLYMNATTYTGTGATLSVTNGVAGQAFQPDMVWIKSRSNALNHNLYDSVRGVQKVLSSNVTSAENYAGTGDLTAFDSNGFTVQQTANYQLSQSGYTYVAWNWKAGGTAVTNTAGSITSLVSANTTSGFSVVTYTGTGSNATVGHGLGVAPKMVIVKNRTNTGSDWTIWQTTLSGTQYLQFNTSATLTNANRWNSTIPTSSVFSVGASGDTNNSGSNYVAYCWAPIAGYSAFGSYTGNGSTDGPFVFLGFRPRFVMIKRTDNVGDWYMLDTSRDPYNLVTQKLMADLSAAENGNGESTSTNTLDILSNGFKMRSTNTASNQSGGTFIYMAFAENPFKYANAR